MIIKLVNAGMEREVEIPLGAEAGAVRRLQDDLEEIGAPSSFTLSVNGSAVEDDSILTPGARVSFRPLQGSKG
jgi:hypothetical protein